MTEADTSPNPVTRFFGGSPLWVLAKLAMLSVIIGVILGLFELNAFTLLLEIKALLYSLFGNIWDALEKLLNWFLLGAVIVFPIWILARVFKLGAKN